MEGGSSARRTAPGEDLPPPPPPRPPRPGFDPSQLSLVIPLAAGAWLGQQTAYINSLGGLQALGSIVTLGLLGLLVMGTAVAGVVTLASGRVVGRAMLAAAGLLVAGGVGGHALAPVLGLTYRAPVTLEASGTAQARLDGEPRFEPREGGGPAECRSVADTRQVAEVTALDLGELGSGTLRASVDLPQVGLDRAYVGLTIDGADLGAGETMPFWNGTITGLEPPGDGTAGAVDFEAALAPPEPPLPPPEGWPSRLTGRITWACEPWLDPDATPPSASGASVSLELTAVDWVPAPEAAGTCESGVDGSATAVASQDVGRLQGAMVTIQVGLRRGLRGGDEITISVVLAGKDPPPGQQYVPNWDGQAVVLEVAPDGRSGRASFTELPTGVDPSVGPAPTGWPATVSGEVAWVCR